MYIDELHKELNGRMLEIWLGTAQNISIEKIEAFRKIWIEEANKPKRPEQSLPPIYKQIWNYGKAFTKHIFHGRPHVTDESYVDRITICNSCDKKTEDWKCAECGCPIESKASWATEDCPLKRWPLPVVESVSISKTEDAPSSAQSPQGCGCNK